MIAMAILQLVWLQLNCPVNVIFVLESNQMENITDPCNFSDSTKHLNEAAYWNMYAVFFPCYFIFGFIGRSLSILAFYHQAKEESAYLFQFFGNCRIVPSV